MRPYVKSLLKHILTDPRTYVATLLSFLVYAILISNYMLFQRSSGFQGQEISIYIAINIFLLISVQLLDIVVTRTEEMHIGWLRSHYFSSIFNSFRNGHRPDSSEYINDITRNLPEVSSILFSLYREFLNVVVLVVILVATVSIDVRALILSVFFLVLFVILSLVSRKFRESNRERMMQERENYYALSESIYLGRSDIFTYRAQSYFSEMFDSSVKRIAQLFESRLMIDNLAEFVHHIFNLLFPLLILTSDEMDLGPKMLLLVFMYFFGTLVGSVTYLIETIGSLQVISENLAIPLRISGDTKRENDRELLSIPDSEFPRIEITNLTLPHCNTRIPRVSISYGEKVVIRGKIGSGKTTLLRCLSGFTTDYQGDLDVHGSVLYIPQEVLILNESLEDNCCFGKPHSDEYLRLIDDFKLKHLSEKPRLSAESLSGGEKKRIAFIRFLLNKKPLNLLDETLTEIDENTLDKMIEYIIGLSETVILVSHSLKVIDSFHNINLSNIKEVI